jgi:hypothetical protein
MLRLLDAGWERLMVRMRPQRRGADDLEELTGFLAAEAHQEPDRQRGAGPGQKVRCRSGRPSSAGACVG